MSMQNIGSLLRSFGISEEFAQRALKASNGDIDGAISWAIANRHEMNKPQPRSQVKTATTQSPPLGNEFLEFEVVPPKVKEPPSVSSEPIKKNKVRIINDIPYLSTGHEKHMANIYIPDISIPNAKFPVVVHVHGGGWQRGDRTSYGAPYMGRAYAERGVVAVVISYRVGLPIAEQIKDVASSVKWVTDTISIYNGNNEQIFLSGHSAGGHLVSLLGTDHKHLENVGVSLKNIKGIVSISGIYSVANPLSDDPNHIHNVLYRTAYVNTVFGQDLSVSQQASPFYHLERVSKDKKILENIPPFLVINAGEDLGLDYDGRKFHAQLNKLGLQSRSEHKMFNHLCHGSITQSEDVAEYAAKFIKKWSTNSEAALA